MKMKSGGKPHKTFSDCAKLDTSGMAGKSVEFEISYEYKPPKMTVRDMLEVEEKKTNKRPEMDD
jgi:hypothetical protein